MTISWTTKPFEALTLAELYALLQLRSEVFVVEQTCPFQDIDGQDQVAYHLLGHTSTGELAAYARLFEAGRSYAQVSIGRVVTSPRYRRAGLGRQLLTQALAECEARFGAQPIKIGAQQYLQAFYESFGFVQQVEGYLEDGIPHLYMLRP
ncbi:GNAT family N-acetyltransferase [Hymenobacter ginsengisoli]|uniref:GNAT family N-acetyltransferase n=1 Tax=Hymenobacter ginsengisoli TaxID=1051626 RepID=A0ABP8QNC2_9BACT|nr:MULTISPECIES: GNAT family N-acetyltransferase [unclassified Hymenobacter]MBO2031077.1 GNAT family N-acetyltransferase [Hymenobacter sp. BT559]